MDADKDLFVLLPALFGFWLKSDEGWDLPLLRHMSVAGRQLFELRSQVHSLCDGGSSLHVTLLQIEFKETYRGW